ncbi:MAG: ATP-binding protein [Rhizobacter sp.]|jgi:signal transduction histidine kinase
MTAGRWRASSLRGRLLVWLVPLLLVAAAASGAASHASYGELVHVFMDRQMVLLARPFAEAGPGGHAAVPAPDDHAVHEWGSFVVQLWSPDGRLLAGGRLGADVPLQAGAGHRDVQGVDGRWRVYTSPPGAVTVQVLQSDRFLSEEVAKRALYAGLPIAMLVPLLLVILWLVVGRASKELRAVADEVAARDTHRAAPLSLARIPEEIVPLVGGFNDLLSRLGAALAAQRRFVQDAAHELRTPVTAVSLQLDLCRSWVPPGLPATQFDRLEAGVRRTLRLVEQLLRLSREEATAGARQPEAVDVTDLLRASVEQFLPLADRRRIEVGFDGQASPSVTGSPVDLRSVFDNLLDNALRYTPEGGQVEIRVHPEGRGAVVDVVDSGPGIDAALRERVFDRFYRVPGSGTDGSGLGLAIARAAASRQGMRLELRSRDDGRGGLVARVHLDVA